MNDNRRKWAVDRSTLRSIQKSSLRIFRAKNSRDSRCIDQLCASDEGGAALETDDRDGTPARPASIKLHSCEYKYVALSPIVPAFSLARIFVLLSAMHFATKLVVPTILLCCSVALATNAKYARAVIESCKGCSLNRLPDVRKFIFEDLPHYENVEYKHVQGEPPELVLYDHHDEEVERLKLAQLTRDECNELLVSKGFKRSSPTAKDEM